MPDGLLNPIYRPMVPFTLNFIFISIIHPFLNFNEGLAKTPLGFDRAWVIASPQTIVHDYLSIL